MKTLHSLAHRILPTGWFVRGMLALNLALGSGYLVFWAMLAWHGLFWRADFSAFYTGWAIVRDGRGAQLYDMDLQGRYQREILDGRSFAQGLLPYMNPPHATIPFVPLAWVSRATAFWIWTLCQLALLIWLLLLLRDFSRSWERYERWSLLSALIALPPLFITFALGTFSLLMLVCLFQFYRTLKSGRERQAGLWLMLGTVKLQGMLLPGVVLLAARRWRALLSALLFGGALVGLSSAWLGWRIWLDFFAALRVIATYFGVFGVDPAEMYNFRGTLALLLGSEYGQLINQLSTAGLAAAAAVTWLLWRGDWRPHEPTFELRMALTMLLAILFNPHLYPHDALMLVAPALLFYVYLRQRNRPRQAYAAVALSSPLLFLVAQYTVGGSLGIRVPVVVMIGLVAWMSKALRDEAGGQRAHILTGSSGTYLDSVATPAERCSAWGRNTVE
jgi:glycosyl transferase family 87